MAYTPHVNGPALVSVGLQLGISGSVSGPLYPVGYTDGGPQISIESLVEPIIADNGGPSVPIDYQIMGKTAKIQMALVVYDGEVFRNWFEGTQAYPGGSLGSTGLHGSLLFATGQGFRLVISSPIDVQPWRFLNCKVDDISQRPGTKYTTYSVNITAIPLLYNLTPGQFSPNGPLLFDHTNA